MAMVMIDFTIVSISVTTIQRDLHLSATAAQWTVTAYALATAAFIALGGRLGDIIGHKRIVAIGIVLFAGASTLCGLTPDTSAAEPWLIVCRVLQGIGGALLIPSTTVLVLNSFPPRGAREGPRGLLHRRRAVHGDRPDRRLLPDPVLDLARDLLDQHPGGAALADGVRVRQAEGRQAPGADRLGRRHPARRRDGVDRARPAGIQRVGLGTAWRRSARSWSGS
jgi:hypothetical protein